MVQKQWVPSNPESIKEIGPLKVVQKTHDHRPKHDWDYHHYEAHDAWKIIMATEDGSHLVLDCYPKEPADWSEVSKAIES